MTPAAEKNLLKDVLREHALAEHCFWVYRQNAINAKAITEGSINYPIFNLNDDSSISVLHSPAKNQSWIIFRRPMNVGNFFVMNTEMFKAFSSDGNHFLLRQLMVNMTDPDDVLNKWPEIIPSYEKDNKYYLKANDELLIIVQADENNQWEVMLQSYNQPLYENVLETHPDKYNYSINFFKMSFGTYDYLAKYINPIIPKALNLYRNLPCVENLIPESYPKLLL